MKTDQVLVVDDDPSTVATLREALAELRCEVTCREDAMGAWEHVQMHERPGVIVIGWVMQGLDGIALCRALREQSGRQPYVILLAGEWRQDDLVAAFRAGADEHVHKPIDAADVTRRVRRALRQVEAREHPDRAVVFEPKADETPVDPYDPTTTRAAGSVVAGRYRVVAPLRSDQGSAVWEGVDAATRARVAIWFTRLGGGRELALHERAGGDRRSLTDPRTDDEVTVLEFGVTPGGVSYVVTSLTASLAPPPMADDDAMGAEPTVRLDLANFRDRLPLDPAAPAANERARNSVSPDPFLRFSHPLMPADESFARVDSKAASAGRRSARRRWAGRSLQAALVLVSVCAVAAGSAWMQRPRERARLTSIPPPADPEAHDAPHAVEAVVHHEPASPDAAAMADAAARAPAPAVASHATDVALERAIWFGRLGEAERMLMAAIAAQPQDATAHARLGFVRFQRGNLRGALLAYRAASEIDRVNVSYLRWLARLQESTGDRAGAVRSLRSMLALAPGDAAARSSLQRLGGA